MKDRFLKKLRAFAEVARWAMGTGRPQGDAPDHDAAEREVLRRDLAAEREARAAAEARCRKVESLLEAPPYSQFATWRDRLREVSERPMMPSSTYSDGLLVEELVHLARRLLERTTVLHNAINRDRTGLAHALARVVEVSRSYWWITEGRGNYAYDEDGYQEETGRALGAIMSVAYEALKNSGTLAAHAVRNEPIPQRGPIPLEVAMNALLLDERRLRVLLASEWLDVRGTEGMPMTIPAWAPLDAAWKEAFVRVGRVVLREALRLSDGGLPPNHEPGPEPVAEA